MNTLEEKIVREYTGYDFDRIENMDVFTYWLYLHDAAIFNFGHSEAGVEYLEKCWLLEQTQPDRNTLRESFGKAAN